MKNKELSLVMALVFVGLGAAMGCGSQDNGSYEKKNGWDPKISDKADGAYEVEKGGLDYSTPGEPAKEDRLSPNHRHRYRFEGKAGSHIRASMDALDADLDCYLSLITPDGELVTEASWDDGGEGRDALIRDFELPATGEYVLLAMSYADRGAGAYQLWLTCLSDSCVPQENSEGRWHQVDKNISSPHDYPNDYDNSWDIQAPDARATRLKIHFARLETEPGWDFVEVYDGEDQRVARLDGNRDGLEVEVEGARARVRLVTDYSVRSYGFDIDRYAYWLGDENEPPVPELRSITAEQAVALAAYARKLRVETRDGESDVMAWSMVNQGCSYRATALEYTVASACEPIEELASPVLRAAEIDEGRIQELIDDPGFDSATIGITGPLIADQILVGSDGSDLSSRPELVHWPYHYGVVIKVDDELKVLDLSLGDEPVAIDVWWRSFVISGVECIHMKEEAYRDVWGFWITITSGWDPYEPPEYLCAYTITEPSFNGLGSTPEVLLSQTECFRTTLGNMGVQLPDNELPKVTSRYSPGKMKDICDIYGLDEAWCTIE